MPPLGGARLRVAKRLRRAMPRSTRLRLVVVATDRFGNSTDTPAAARGAEAPLRGMRFAAATVLAGACGLAAAAPASAAITCTYDGTTQNVTVSTTGANTIQIQVSGGAIEVFNVACSPTAPTWTTRDEIQGVRRRRGRLAYFRRPRRARS